MVRRKVAPGLPDKDVYGEPDRKLTPGQLATYVLQHHRTKRRPNQPHYDLRIGTPETDLFSWAVPGAELPAAGKRVLAPQTKLHKFPYGKFQGRIGKGYGAGNVTMADRGEVKIDKISPNSVHFTTQHGNAPVRYALVRIGTGRTGRDWLLIRPKDKPVPEQTDKAAADKLIREPSWIGVDLDGTLAKYTHFKSHTDIGEPIPRMVKRVKKWLKDGKTVKIMTARADGMDAKVKKAIQAWCRKHIGKTLEITNVKNRGMVELWDDRAVTVEKNTGVRKSASKQIYARMAAGEAYKDRLSRGSGLAPHRAFETAESKVDDPAPHPGGDKPEKPVDTPDVPLRGETEDDIREAQGIRKSAAGEVEISAKVKGDGIHSVLKILRALEITGGIGHSHSVVVDPETTESKQTVGWDGDGADGLSDISINGKKLSRKNLKDITKGKFKLKDAKGYDTKEKSAQTNAPAAPTQYTPDQLYQALATVETGGQANPFIRTQVRDAKGGSTAYGPVQLTGRLVKEYAGKYPKLFADPEKAYLKRFVDQGKQFVYHGNMRGKVKDFNPAYDYGGPGDMGATDPDRQMYAQVAQKIMNHIYAKKKFDLTRFIQAWRGKGPKQAPNYYQKVYAALGHKPQVPMVKAQSDTMRFQVVTKEGQVKAEFEAEIADTPELRRKGLSKRAYLPSGYGMFFDKVGAYHMLDVNFPLDIVFVDKQGTILEKQYMGNEDQRCLYMPENKEAEHAIELPAGWCDKHGMEAGDHIRPVSNILYVRENI